MFQRVATHLSRVHRTVGIRGFSSKCIVSEFTQEDSTLSYLRGSTDGSQLVTDTVYQTFSKSVQKYGDRDFLIAPFQTLKPQLSYSEASAEVDTIALSLLALGYEVGDRLCILSHNNKEWLLLTIACAKIGVVLVTLNPAYQGKELLYSLNKVGAKGLVFAQSFKQDSTVAVVSELFPEIKRSAFIGYVKNEFPSQLFEKVPSLHHLVHLADEDGAFPSNAATIRGCLSFANLLRGDFITDKERIKLPKVMSSFDHLSPINVQFSSGTTGLPKAISLSSYNIVNNAKLIAERMQLTEKDKVLCNPPFFHCFGLVIASLCSIYTGAGIILPNSNFSASKAVECAAKYKATAFMGVPTMMLTMLSSKNFPEHQEEIKKYARTGVIAGSLASEALMSQLSEKMNLHGLLNGYGQTECSPIVSMMQIDSSFVKKTTTVGTVMPHTEIKVVNAEGDIVPRGQEGELCARGYQVMRGYIDYADKIDSDITNKAIIDGWMHSGDLATIDDEGYITITGRIKDLIIRGGENISPKEIEENLTSHFEEIQDAQVVGIPDEFYGEEICVCIILKEGQLLTAEQVREHIEHTLSKYKVPKYVKFLDSYPLTASGKVQKFILRDQLKQEFKLQKNNA